MLAYVVELIQRCLRLGGIFEADILQLPYKSSQYTITPQIYQNHLSINYQLLDKSVHRTDSSVKFLIILMG